MKFPKRYGQSLSEHCPFCDKSATTRGPEGVSVCPEHKNNKLPEMKCVCGSYLDLKKGKHGVFFSCLNCGIVSLKKVLEYNDVKIKKPDNHQKKSNKVTHITSDELDLM